MLTLPFLVESLSTTGQRQRAPCPHRPPGSARTPASAEQTFSCHWREDGSFHGVRGLGDRREGNSSSSVPWKLAGNAESQAHPGWAESDPESEAHHPRKMKGRCRKENPSGLDSHLETSRPVFRVGLFTYLFLNREKLGRRRG